MQAATEIEGLLPFSPLNYPHYNLFLKKPVREEGGLGSLC